MSHADGPPLRSGKPIAIVLAVLFIGAALIKWWPSDTRAIRRQLDALADIISVPPAESDVSRVARLADLRSYFTPGVRIHLTEMEIASRDELVALASRWTAPPGGAFVEFQDERMTLPGDNTARVEATAKISRKDPATGDVDEDERPATFDLAKIDGDWVITGVESQAARPAR
jgi:hypothetical protein